MCRANGKMLGSRVWLRTRQNPGRRVGRHRIVCDGFVSVSSVVRKQRERIHYACSGASACAS